MKNRVNRRAERAAEEEFARLDIRVGTGVKAEPFPQVRVPAIRMEIDFGPLGEMRWDTFTGLVYFPWIEYNGDGYSGRPVQERSGHRLNHGEEG